MANNQVKPDMPVTAGTSDEDLGKLAAVLAYHAAQPAWIWKRFLEMEREIKRLGAKLAAMDEKLASIIKAGEETD